MTCCLSIAFESLQCSTSCLLVRWWACWPCLVNLNSFCCSCMHSCQKYHSNQCSLFLRQFKPETSCCSDSFAAAWLLRSCSPRCLMVVGGRQLLASLWYYSFWVILHGELYFRLLFWFLRFPLSTLEVSLSRSLALSVFMFGFQLPWRLQVLHSRCYYCCECSLLDW